MSTRHVMSFDNTSETLKQQDSARRIDHSQAMRAYQETLNMPLQTRSTSLTQKLVKDGPHHSSGPIETSNSDQQLTNAVSYHHTTSGENKSSNVSSSQHFGLKRNNSHTASVQQKLSHLRNVFGSIRQSLQDDSC